MKDEIGSPGRPRKRRLTLGVDKVSSIIEQLKWSKLETCFGSNFEFDAEMKYELAHEIALQHGRLDDGKNGNLPFGLKRIKETAKLLKDQIDEVYLSGDAQNIESLETSFCVNTECDRARFEVMIDKLVKLKSGANYCPPSDLYRDCIKAIASQLNKSGINLSLYKNSPFHKFILELDNQLPNTIFPVTTAVDTHDSRFRAMRDYLRSWYREKF